MIRFIHAADFHLDSPFDALPPEKAALRRQEGRELLDRLAQLCRDRQADLLLLAGDLLDSARAYGETAEALERFLASLSIPVFLAPGNHDPYSPRSLWRRLPLPEHVHLFTEPSLQRVDLPVLNCAVWGAGFPAARLERSPLSGFQAPEDGMRHLMVLHGDLGGGTGDYGPLTPADIAGSRLSYLALGHIHGRMGPERAGKTTWAYPGCPEGRGFDELDEKGVFYGEMAEDGAVTLEFIPLAKRRYRILELDLTEQSPEAALEAALTESLSEDLLRVIFTGERDEAQLPLTRLRQQFEGRCFSLDLRDQSRIRRDIWAQAGDDGLKALFLRQMRAGYESAEDPALWELAVRYGLAALDDREEGL